MARGWESKSVEAQMEESRESRKRIAQQLEASSNEKYSELLCRTLADLDRQIAELSG